MAIAAPSTAGLSAFSDVRDLGAKVLGLAIATLAPALFWVAVAALATRLAGVPVTLAALGLLGGAISLFLAAACAPILLRHR